MKTIIRDSVFETNSSSCHSLVLINNIPPHAPIGETFTVDLDFYGDYRPYPIVGIHEKLCYLFSMFAPCYSYTIQELNDMVGLMIGRKIGYTEFEIGALVEYLVIYHHVKKIVFNANTADYQVYRNSFCSVREFLVEYNLKGLKEFLENDSLAIEISS